MENRQQVKEAILNCGLDKQVSRARKKAVFQDDTSELYELGYTYGFDVVKVALNVLFGTWKKSNELSKGLAIWSLMENAFS